MKNKSKLNNIQGNLFLVTGGAGLVGSHIVDDLVRYNAKKIIVFDDFSRGNHNNLKWALKNGNIDVINADICNYKLLKKAMQDVDFVFHQAAIRITECAQNIDLAHDVMSSGTLNIAKAASQTGVKKVILASSASVYGQADIFPTNETHHPYSNDTFYGSTKLYLEGIFKSFYAMYDLDYVILRYFNIYGPRMDTAGKYTEVLIRWLDCIKRDTPPLIFGDGSTSMDLIHVKDIAEANILAMKSNVSDEIINIGTQIETTLKELLNILLKINNSSLIPVFKKERDINSVERRLADISKAKKLLEFSPRIQLLQGLKQLSDWYNKT